MKKTIDGRFIEKRVRINQSILKKIILSCKVGKYERYVSLAKYLGVSDHTLRYGWLKKGETIPLSILKKLLKLNPTINFQNIKNEIKILEPFWGQRIGKRYKTKIKIEVDGKNEEKYAEFYGIMLGDGCIYSNLSGICISGNSILDKNYIQKYVIPLINTLFDINPKIYYSKKANSIRAIVYSKDLVKFLLKDGFPKGKKMFSKTEIPKRFFKKPKLIASCIRGLNDTDGSIYPRKNVKIVLDISIKSPTLLKSSVKAFNSIEFPIKYTKNRIYIYGEKQIKDFFELIGSSNQRNILKYQSFIKKGVVPTSHELEKFIRENNH